MRIIPKFIKNSFLFKRGGKKEKAPASTNKKSNRIAASAKHESVLSEIGGIRESSVLVNETDLIIPPKHVKKQKRDPSLNTFLKMKKMTCSPKLVEQMNSIKSKDTISRLAHCFVNWNYIQGPDEIFGERDNALVKAWLLKLHRKVNIGNIKDTTSNEQDQTYKILQNIIFGLSKGDMTVKLVFEQKTDCDRSAKRPKIQISTKNGSKIICEDLAEIMKRFNLKYFSDFHLDQKLFDWDQKHEMPEGALTHIGPGYDRAVPEGFESFSYVYGRIFDDAYRIMGFSDKLGLEERWIPDEWRQEKTSETLDLSILRTLAWSLELASELNAQKPVARQDLKPQVLLSASKESCPKIYHLTHIAEKGMPYGVEELLTQFSDSSILETGKAWGRVMSTSSAGGSYAGGLDAIQYKIHVAPQSIARPVSQFSVGDPYEQEHMFPADTQFKVLQATVKKEGWTNCFSLHKLFGDTLKNPKGALLKDYFITVLNMALINFEELGISREEANLKWSQLSEELGLPVESGIGLQNLIKEIISSQPEFSSMLIDYFSSEDPSVPEFMAYLCLNILCQSESFLINFLDNSQAQLEVLNPNKNGETDVSNFFTRLLGKHSSFSRNLADWKEILNKRELIEVVLGEVTKEKALFEPDFTDLETLELPKLKEKDIGALKKVFDEHKSLKTLKLPSEDKSKMYGEYDYSEHSLGELVQAIKCSDSITEISCDIGKTGKLYVRLRKEFPEKTKILDFLPGSVAYLDTLIELKKIGDEIPDFQKKLSEIETYTDRMDDKQKLIIYEKMLPHYETGLAMALELKVNNLKEKLHKLYQAKVLVEKTIERFKLSADAIKFEVGKKLYGVLHLCEGFSYSEYKPLEDKIASDLNFNMPLDWKESQRLRDNNYNLTDKQLDDIKKIDFSWLNDL